jgi:hypothetical protein
VRDSRFGPDLEPKWSAFNDSAVARAADGAWRSAAVHLLFHEGFTGGEAEDPEGGVS